MLKVLTHNCASTPRTSLSGKVVSKERVAYKQPSICDRDASSILRGVVDE